MNTHTHINFKPKFGSKERIHVPLPFPYRKVFPVCFSFSFCIFPTEESQIYTSIIP